VIAAIVATRGRSAELATLFDSFLAQHDPPALEVIVVDQNSDDRVVPIIAVHAGRLRIAHLRSAVANANHARNLGLRAAASPLVCFPDDDCWWQAGVQARVEAAFADPRLALLTGPAASPEGGLGSGRWREAGGPITRANVWTSVIEFNLFLRRELALTLGGFDETMGPGTRFGSAEGNDLVARAIRAGHACEYDPGLRIVHPDKRMTDVAADRAELYGAGLGRALRRHAPITAAAPFFVRPLGGMALAALRGDALARRYYAATWVGRVRGFLAR
jgi:glycosyltransferase involved in cell wall biosynthesis